MTWRRWLLTLALLVLPMPAFAQATHITTSGTLPASCRVGDAYYKTGASAGLYACTASNTWTLNSASAGTGDVAGPASAVADRVAVFDGTTGKLIKDGGQTIATIAAGAGSVVLIEQHTASSSASLDLTTCFTSTYDTYQIELVNLVNATNNQDLFFQVSTNGGATYSTTTYEFHAYDASTSNAVGSLFSTSATGVMLFTGVDNSQSYGTSGRITLYDPLNASLKKTMTYQVSSTLQAVARRYTVFGSGFWGTTTAVNAARVIYASGNITSGTIRCYGLAK